MERISIEDYRALIAPEPAEKRDLKAPKKARKRTIKGLPKVERPMGFLQVIQRLMSYHPPRNLRIKEEEALAIAFANALRQASIQRRLRCIWTHPANEIAGRRDGKAQIRYTIAKAMGMIDGASDYLFLWSTGSGALEAKFGKNGQQNNQRDFEAWCIEMGVPYRTFTTVEEGLAILTEWGVYSPETKALTA